MTRLSILHETGKAIRLTFLRCTAFGLILQIRTSNHYIAFESTTKPTWTL